MLAILLGLTNAQACIWDRDTLATEMKGLPDVERVIYGDFERYPDAYYAMRLERVTAALAQTPDDLALYDDAGAAADRLGRSDEAVAFMERKRAVLDALADTAPHEHRYRMHANLGTFLVHRWIRAGAPRDAMADLDAAIGHIEQALVLDPEAHFGRERVQLALMKWVRDAGPFTYELDTFLERRGFKVDDDDSQDATLEGLRGLVVLGAAWESVDTYYALRRALQLEGRNHAAALAGLRARELALAGRPSLQPGAPTGAKLAELVSGFDAVSDEAAIERAYAAGRELAEARATERRQAMEARLAAGLHPDTHPDFWTAELPAELPVPETLPSTREGGWCGCSAGSTSPGTTFFPPGWARRR
ncbi:MAG: hypothetical protein R3F61_24230 [Myxococcota bacterium]